MNNDPTQWLGETRGLTKLLRSRLGRDAGWTLLLKVVHIGLGFLVTVVLARVLGAEGYGVYAYAYAIVAVLALPAQAGLPPLLVRETARGVAVRNMGFVRAIWHWSVRVIGATTLGISLIAGPVLVVWQGGFESVSGRTMAWALALVPLIALGNLGGAALRGFQRIAPGQLHEFIIRPGVFLFLLGGMAIVGQGIISPDNVMGLHVAAALVAMGGVVVMLWRMVPTSVWRAPPVRVPRGLLRTSMFFAFLSGGQVINAYADTVILGIIEAPADVGVYRVAVQVSILASVGLNIANMVLAPRFADLYARGEMERLQRLVTAGARFGLIVNLVLTVVFVGLGGLFMPLIFGEEFGSSYAPLVILLAGQVVSSLAGPVGNLLNMAGHERTTARTMTIAASLNIALNFLLIPILGLVGAAAATAISVSLWNILLYRRVSKDLGLNSLAVGNRSLPA